jgi:predicted ribosomally synthesized peptide with SipW-like signal peptide
MKPIITSIGMIVFVAAIVAGGTGAFFSDTETSTGNVFTAGAIDLTVDSTQHYNGMVCSATSTTYTWQPEAGYTPVVGQYPAQGSLCDGTWVATDLGAQKFWNFLDIKPGDNGENTISLHVDNNDAYACVDVAITKNDDVTCNDPENAAEGVGICQNDPVGLFDGELAQNLTFFAWSDWGATPGFQGQDVGEGDNIWQANEPKLFSNTSGPASDVLDGESYTLADSVTGPLVGNSTSYIGLAWCAGTIDATTPGTILCNGATMGNEAQTDSMEASIAFRVEQARNNPNFTCTPRVVVETGTVTLDKIVTFSNGAIGGVDVTDFALHLVGPGGDHLLVDQVAFPNLTPGAYVVSEVYSNDPANVTSDATFTGSCAEIGISNTATMNVIAGVNPVCTITNNVVLNT